MKPLPRRPLVGLVIFVLAGTWTGLNWEAPTAACFGLAAGLVLAGWVAARPFHSALAARHVSASFRDRLGTFCIYGSIFLLAWLNSSLRAGQADAPPLATYLGASEMRAEVTGVISDQPEQPAAKGDRTNWRFPLRVEKLRITPRGAAHDVSGTVRVSCYAPRRWKSPAYGERWAMSGRLSPSVQTAAGGLPRRRPVFLTADGRGARRLSTGHGSWVIQQCLKARTAVLKLLTLGIEGHPEAVRILESLLLGYRSQMPKDLYRAFAATGTLHIFAISGCHVGVLAAIIIFALSACGITRLYWVFLMAPLLILYTLMTGIQPSAVRACIMAVVYWAAPLLRRKPDIYSSLALAAVIILAVVPADLSDAGFVLSFVAVLGLLLLFPVIVQPFRRRFAQNPLQIQPDPPVRRSLRAAWTYFGNLCAASSAAWLATAPLTAYYFQTLSPIGLIGNLIAIPLASLIIVTGTLALCLGACASALAVVFNHADLVLASGLAGLIRWLAAVPGGWMRVDAPPLWLLIGFYVILTVWRIKFQMDMMRAEQL